ncbi:hypothetical protein B8V81_2970 [Paenibacillus pasadenensis]|uniref:Uncharacterized protein n=1 Tax=Paenibacillus pasadenensis TaxID=217090 RepID=A0A2N5N2I9_9BACL|nr:MULTISPECIES: hypothetical protein [Paenibacillus]PLT44539.1 hypothetical protein B8V81_2970 [Paenibacillus pasadenensis]
MEYMPRWMAGKLPAHGNGKQEGRGGDAETSRDWPGGKRKAEK